jgi:hypothetical protein
VEKQQISPAFPQNETERTLPIVENDCALREHSSTVLFAASPDFLPLNQYK